VLVVPVGCSRSLYQLTGAGQAAEQAIAFCEEAIGRGQPAAAMQHCNVRFEEELTLDAQD